MAFVFTYGTLKRGFRNHILLAHCALIDTVCTKPKYLLYDCGSYPCMVKSDNGKYIKGEVYEVDPTTLKRLDQLEGVPWLYQRDTVELVNFPHDTIAYFYQESIQGFVECGESWPRK